MAAVQAVIKCLKCEDFEFWNDYRLVKKENQKSNCSPKLSLKRQIILQNYSGLKKYCYR